MDARAVARGWVRLASEHVFKAEVKTLEMVDEAVNNSKISNDIFRKFYPQFHSKIRAGYVDTTATVLPAVLTAVFTNCDSLRRNLHHNGLLPAYSCRSPDGAHDG